MSDQERWQEAGAAAFFRLEDELKEKYVRDVAGEKKKRTLEEALQEALDNTTPESPGAPEMQDEPEEQDVEWI